MKVIVVGGCGFLGLYIAEQFARKGIKIVLLDSKERYIKTEPDIKNTSLLYEPIGKVAPIIIPGIKEISQDSTMSNTIQQKVVDKLEATVEQFSD